MRTLCSSSITSSSFCFFLNDTRTTEIYTLSLHDALPISPHYEARHAERAIDPTPRMARHIEFNEQIARKKRRFDVRSEEHTSELQSRQYLVCRLLLEKKKTN